jgi:type IV fimbrial biogenesis protein FimT
MKHCYKKPYGFTLIELMMTIAVAAILFGIAVPQFSTVTQNARISSARNGLFTAFQLARTEAITRRMHVVVCASVEGESCSGAWVGGALVFVDANRNRQRESSERLLTQFNADAFKNLNVQGSRRLTSFGPDGRSGGSNQTLAVCAPGRNDGLSVVISNAGRVRMGKTVCS